MSDIKQETKTSTLEELHRTTRERKIKICKGCKCDNNREEYLECCYCEEGNLYNLTLDNQTNK